MPRMDVEWIEEEGDEVLPDVSGLEPVRAAATLQRERTPEEALRHHWGFDSFRPLQLEAIAAALDGRDSLVILPTGGGKSLCYQVPAACRPGTVLVVSPLIALMDDQVAAARQVDIRAAALHSGREDGDRRRAYAEAVSGQLDLLYVSPERLCVGDGDLLTQLAPHLALVAVDEAHCISHWGHDFRPEYRRLAPLLSRLESVPRMGLTATATPQVQDDICHQLGLRKPLRLVGHPDRPNLSYRCLARKTVRDQVLAVVQRHPGEGGIVYAQTRKAVERIAGQLVKAGVHAAGYHAGLPAPTRARVQADFVAERLDVVVATIAFGMGIDRSNVRYVVHANTPRSIEHYQQESGRAGRDGLPAECVLLFAGGDLALHRQLALSDGPLSPERRSALDTQLAEVGRFAIAPVCRHRLLAEHFGFELTHPDGKGCGACDVCLGETREMPAEESLVLAQKIISAVWRTGSRFGAGHVVAVLLGRGGERLQRLGHDQLSVYGLLKDAGEQPIRGWIDQLVVQGHLQMVDSNGYPILGLTDAGVALCKGRGEVRLTHIEAGTRSGGSSGGGRAARREAEDWSGVDRDCFEHLRALRKHLAEGQGVPPYVVFGDTALRAMAEAKPADETGFLAIKGVGEAKMARYGRAFLAAIQGRPVEDAAALIGT